MKEIEGASNFTLKWKKVIDSSDLTTKIPSKEYNNYDKLYKFRPFLKNLNKQFFNCYESSEVQAINESMIKFKGRCSFKQYIPLKPIKKGYKFG